ncbi:MAG TPA: hypothetical protein VFY12_01815 [Arenimonas sp.]|nr:hypothetical protein [Arenimonas sp.]
MNQNTRTSNDTVDTTATGKSAQHQAPAPGKDAPAGKPTHKPDGDTQRNDPIVAGKNREAANSGDKHGSGSKGDKPRPAGNKR